MASQPLRSRQSPDSPLRDRVLKLTITEPPAFLGATHWSSQLLAATLVDERTPISHVTVA